MEPLSWLLMRRWTFYITRLQKTWLKKIITLKKIKIFDAACPLTQKSMMQMRE